MMNTSDTHPAQSVEEFLGVPPETGKRKLRRWLIGGGVLLLLMILLLSLMGGKESGPRYATAELRSGDMVVHVTATGNLEPTNEVIVGSELSGLIDEVFVDVNDRVVTGQPLAQIDTERLNDAIRRSEAALEQAKASVLQAEASLELSQVSLKRLEDVYRLSGGKVPSQAELDAAQAETKRAHANLLSAQASVLSAEAQLSTDHTNLQKATIRSPVDGVILSRDVEPGQTVAASFNTPQLFVIAEDLSQMKLEIKVDEADVGLVEAGQPTHFTVDAYPGKVFEAAITRVNVGANQRTAETTSGTTSNVISYGAILSVNNEDLALRPGMTATARILVRHEQDALMVPNSALRFRPRAENPEQGGFSMFGPPGRNGEQQAVSVNRGATQTLYVLDDKGQLVDMTVRIGSSDGAWTIVSGDGLKPGMKVVTAELTQLP